MLSGGKKYLEKFQVPRPRIEPRKEKKKRKAKTPINKGF